MREIQKRVQEVRDAHRICKYNVHEDNCDTWLKQFKCGRCSLSGSDICPGHIKRTWDGLKAKNFKIDGGVYRKLSSAAHYLVNESKTKTLFITLTFPAFKRKVSNEEINQLFSKFVENLRTNYNCGGYIAVREFGKANHRIHFHLLCAIPFVPFTDLNNTWCNTIKNICVYSRRALLTDNKTIFIREPTRALRYVCKYFSKAKGQSSKTRLVFISNNIIQKPRVFPGNINFRDVLTGYGFTVHHTSDYTTMFRVENPVEFKRFCYKFLYPFFELSDKKPENLYSFPINSS
jgi:hypothetical protein